MLLVQKLSDCCPPLERSGTMYRSIAKRSAHSRRGFPLDVRRATTSKTEYAANNISPTIHGTFAAMSVSTTVKKTLLWMRNPAVETTWLLHFVGPLQFQGLFLCTG